MSQYIKFTVSVFTSQQLPDILIVKGLFKELKTVTNTREATKFPNNLDEVCLGFAFRKLYVCHSVILSPFLLCIQQ